MSQAKEYTWKRAEQLFCDGCAQRVFQSRRLSEPLPVRVDSQRDFPEHPTSTQSVNFTAGEVLPIEGVNLVVNTQDLHIPESVDISNMSALDLFYLELRQIPRLDDAETDQLLSDISKKRESGFDFTEERNRLVNGHLGLVVNSARRYLDKVSTSSFSRDDYAMDLIQEGVMGLMEAIDRFDVSHGSKFSTYAFHWIKAYVSPSFRSLFITRGIAFSEDAIEKYIDYQNVCASFFNKHNRLPSYEEIIEGLEKYGFSADVSKRILIDIVPLIVGNRYLYESSAAHNRPNIDTVKLDFDFVEGVHNRDFVLQCFEHLRGLVRSDPKESVRKQIEVLQLRYGFLTGDLMTLREVGEVLGCSRQNASQHEQTALAYLRKFV